MFTSIHLEGFKGWANTGPVRLAPLSVFFGTNSSGKSSLLQSLLLLKQTAASADRSHVLFPGDDTSLVDLGTFRDMLFGHDLERQMQVSIEWRTTSPVTLPTQRAAVPVHALGFSVHIAAGDREQPIVNELRYVTAAGSVGMTRKGGTMAYELAAHGFRLKHRRGRAWPLPSPTRFYGFPDEATNYYQRADWLVDLSLSLERKLASVQYVGPRRRKPQRTYLWAGQRPEAVGPLGEHVVAALLAAHTDDRKIGRGQGKGRRYRAFQEVIAQWLHRMELVHSFRVASIGKNRKDYEVKLRRTETSAEVLITDVGFGISQVLPVLVETYSAREGETVILEQPELHLHPRVQAELADVLVDAAQCGNVQFLVETHSEHFLHRLQRRIAEKALAPDFVSLYFCEVRGDRSEIEELRVDPSGFIVNWPKDFFGDEFADLAAMTRAAARRSGP